MNGAEIRARFLKYFQKNGHTSVESSSLVPQNDPTLLFTNAGMVQFKDVFLGQESRPYKRATTSQKCVRAGGKHNDLENVGFTARHHTFFEMLGNFSFGDYFKKDAIHFAWEFSTQELGLDKKHLYVTVFKDDDEAAEIWHKQEGVPRDRISRFGEKDNFWAMGETGPCGPCSELFIDRGEKYGCGKATCAVGCDCDRFMEFWNLVFMQFNRDTSGKLNPLPKPSVDTGAGLERIASILQKVDTNYDTDLFQEIIGRTARLSGVRYGKDPEKNVSFRVIADHSRATAFLIGDGVMPSNEGRGYVLRRIMRRAIRHGKKLGFDGPFLNETSGYVIDQMVDAYPDLKQKRAFIAKAVKAEEEQFFKTLERGLALLDEEMKGLKKSDALAGETAFKLYDTFGFPIDLTRVILAEHGFSVDEAGFDKSMGRQRDESRKHWKGSGDTGLDKAYLDLVEELKKKKKLPVFTGYDSTETPSKCLAIFEVSPSGLNRVDESKSKDLRAVFEKTPFYGESGGQVGDRGAIESADFEGDVTDVQRPVADLIVAHVTPKKGALKVGKSYRQLVDPKTRGLTARNHTATHLLHWALREVLGDHVKQAGSLVNPQLLRFDFAHFQAMTPAEIQKVEDLINERIWRAEPVSKKVMEKDKAVKAGAIAFFGEKYGKKVRVVSVGDFSTELCGGTHVDNASEISLFRIISESGIAAGVRRIIAYTSEGAFQHMRARENDLNVIRDQLRASAVEEISGKIEKLVNSEKVLRKEIDQMQSQATSGEVDGLIADAKSIKGIRLVTSIIKTDASGAKKLRDVSEQIKQKAPDSVTVLGMKDVEQGKAFLIAAVGSTAIGSVQANKLIEKLAPFIGGRGGGKPEMAQAGGNDLSGIDKALAEVQKLI